MTTKQNFNLDFYNKYSQGGELQKRAEYALNSYVRSEMREHGLVRSSILPALTIEDAQLDKDDDPKILKKYMDSEPNTFATWVPYRGVAPSRLVKATRSPIYFGKIESVQHKVEIHELITYSHDLRSILDEHDIKEMQKEEDRTFFDTLQVLINLDPTRQIVFLDGMTRNNFISAQQAFNPKIPIHVAVMNVNTYKEYRKWNYDSDVPQGEIAQAHYLEGRVDQLHNIKIVKTIKTDIVADGEVYFFAPPDFIGKFLELRQPTTYVEQKKDWLFFSSSEVVGMGIKNTQCFLKAIFQN